MDPSLLSKPSARRLLNPTDSVSSIAASFSLFFSVSLKELLFLRLRLRGREWPLCFLEREEKAVKREGSMKRREKRVVNLEFAIRENLCIYKIKTGGIVGTIPTIINS